MNISGERTRALVLVGAFVASVCACRERSARESSGAPDVESTAAPAAVPALWEPIDKSFKGCEGG